MRSDKKKGKQREKRFLNITVLVMPLTGVYSFQFSHQQKKIEMKMLCFNIKPILGHWFFALNSSDTSNCFDTILDAMKIAVADKERKKEKKDYSKCSKCWLALCIYILIDIYEFRKIDFHLTSGG